MLEPKNITIEDKEFNLNPLKIRTALRLDKKVISLILPLLGGVKDLDSEINLGSALGKFSESLNALPDNEYEAFTNELFSTVTYLPKGEAPVELNQAMDIAFQGNITSVYKLMWEIMKYNKFSPFELMAGGLGTLTTLISPKNTENEKSTGDKLEK